MNFLNLGFSEIVFIIIIALIIFGPKNMVKSARDAGVFLRKVVKSPYWQEVWATKRDFDEFPKMLAKEAKLNETLESLDHESRNIKGTVSQAMNDLLKEADKLDNDNADQPISQNRIQPPDKKDISTESKESKKE